MSDSPYSSLISPGFEISNRYVLIEEIGRGGTATIYRAMDIASGETVAVKHLTLNAEMSGPDREMRIMRFRNEALTMQLLRHPHIMSVYDFKQIGSDYFMVVEFLQGLNLKEYVERHAPNHREILHWIEQLLDALEYSHSKHIIHRDIKPENVMIVTGKKVKLLDFGIAKIEGQNQLTIDGSLLGTVAYMSPEQIQNSRLITAQSDLYSLGVLMYELFTGKMPFNATNHGTAVLEIFSRDPIPPMQINPNVGPDLNQLILNCMQKLPQHRFASSRQLQQMIRVVLDKAYSEVEAPNAKSQAVLPRIRLFESFRLIQAVSCLMQAEVDGLCLIWNAWQQGSIGFKHGEIYYADIKGKHLGGDLLLMDLLSWESGNFLFIPSAPVEGSGQYLDYDQHVLMEEAQNYLHEIEILWPDYQDQDIPELLREPAKSETFSKLAQAVFSWIDGQRCIGQLFAVMPQDRLSILWGIRELEDRKYIFVERIRSD